MMDAGLSAALRHLRLRRFSAPDAPGPFALRDAERVRGILSRAGFGEVRCEALDEMLAVAGGADLDRTVEVLLQIGPTAAAMREVDAEVARLVASADARVHRAVSHAAGCSHGVRGMDRHGAPVVGVPEFARGGNRWQLHP